MMPLLDQPLVSCICISSHGVELLHRAVQCFMQQTYLNKELVIVYSDTNTATAKYVKSSKDVRILSIELPVTQTLTLGEKRNIAVAKSNGVYFCVWDDDDWSGRSRIAFQVEQLRRTKFKSIVLTRLLVYDAPNARAYLSGERWAWEQTLLCAKSVTTNPDLCYPPLERGEDSALIFNLREHDLLTSAKSSALYVYVYHGENTWDRTHWEENIFAHAFKLSDAKSHLLKQVLDGKFSSKKAAIILTAIVRS